MFAVITANANTNGFQTIIQSLVTMRKFVWLKMMMVVFHDTLVNKIPKLEYVFFSIKSVWKQKDEKEAIHYIFVAV